LGTEGLTQERIAINQSRFREANEPIELAADNMELLGPIPFICECADRPAGRSSASPSRSTRTCERTRASSSAPPAIRQSVETGAGVVIDHADGQVLVEKVGVAGEIAAEEHRRSNHRPADA